MCSSFCFVSPCPVAATHMSLSNYLGQQHQIMPTEIILKGTESSGWRCLVSASGQNVDKCIMNAERTETRIMVAATWAKAGLKTLGDPNCIKSAISYAAQAERSGLSVILSAQLNGSSCLQIEADRIPMFIWDDNDNDHLGLYGRCSIVKCLNLEPALLSILMHPAVAATSFPLRVPTRGSDFHNAHAALYGSFFQNALLQSVQNSLFWELWQDLQIINWYIKLGPVVGNHTLTVLSRRKERRVWRYLKSKVCIHVDTQ